MKRTLYQRLVRSNESQLLRQIFADLEYLGIIEKYGTCCLFINALAAEILKLHHFDVELRACIAVVDQEGRGRFLLGAKEFSLPGQIPSHIVCIINKSVLLDFGLGNVRKNFHSDFYQAMLLPVSNYEAAAEQVLCEAHPSFRCSLSYVADLPPETLDHEMEAQKHVLAKCLLEYQRYAKNRLKFNVARALRKLYRARLFSVTQKPELGRLAGNFDETHFN